MSAIDKLYAGGQTVWVVPDENSFKDLDMTYEDFSPSTYGELTAAGASSIISKFHSRFMDPEGVFYDLGCGLGRMVCHVSLLTNVKKSCGVEMCPNRFKKAKEIATSLGEFPASTPTFINGNFLEQDYSDATVVYIDNTMYTTEILCKVIEIIPDDCILIYQGGWIPRGDPFFQVETTYNRRKKFKGKPLVQMSSLHAGWTYGKGHEF